jgi:hypothetical protein
LDPACAIYQTKGFLSLDVIGFYWLVNWEFDAKNFGKNFEVLGLLYQMFSRLMIFGKLK